MTSSLDYPRKIGLIVSDGTTGIDLSNLRIVFQTSAPDTDMPPGAVIRVYNLSETTTNTIVKEFQKVMLQAGYEGGNYGIIFQGTIKQLRRGRENNIDSFLDIIASDGDAMYAYSVVSKTLAPGATLQDQANAVSEATASQGTPVNVDSLDPASVGGVDPKALRSTTLFGMAPNVLNSIANTAGSSWSIRDGQVVFTPLTAYSPGEVIKLNSATGLIGVPETMLDGVHVRCLLNPNIKVGRRIEINNADIVNTQVLSQGFPRARDVTLFPSVTNDGIYRVYEMTCSGDTRGTAWWIDLICLSVDPSSAAGQSVQAYG